MDSGNNFIFSLFIKNEVIMGKLEMGMNVYEGLGTYELITMELPSV